MARLLVLVALLMSMAAQAAAPVVQPSGPSVPANLLRIGLVFDAPVTEPVLARLTLRQVGGAVLDQPFLMQELWSPNGTILTVLLHPGRVKSGLVAHDTLGPVLEAGQQVELLLDERVIKRWKVAPAKEHGPQLADWRVGKVAAGSRQPLRVELDAAIDAREAAYIAVADAKGVRVPGRAVLGEGERVWTFSPARRWKAGQYRLVANANLEDAAGNRTGVSFEAPIQTTLAADSAIAFFIAP